MPVTGGNEQILLNTNLYTIVPASYKVEDISKMPPAVREGFPTYDQLSKESAVAWDDWIGGFGEIEYGSFRTADRVYYLESNAQPDRFYFSTDCATNIKRQITLGHKQNTTNANWTPTLIRQCEPTQGVIAVTSARYYSRSGAATWDAGQAPGGTLTDVIAWGDGANTLYLIAQGTTAYQYATSYANFIAGTTTASNLGGNSQIAQFWCAGPAASGTSGGTLWKAVLPNLVYASSNPKNGGAWTTAYTVGSSATNITGIVMFDNRLLVGKPEGLFWVHADGTVDPLIDMSGAVDAANCSGMTSWGGALFVPWVQGLYIYKGGNILNLNDALPSFRDIGPNLNTGNASTVRGKVVAMCPSPTHLYAVIKSDAAKYYILAYNGDTTPGRGWHPVANLGTNTCTTIAWETVQTNPVLFFGSGATVNYLIMPRSSDNQLLDSNCRFQTDGTIQMPAYESPLRGVQKCYLDLVVNIEGSLSGTVYVDFNYYIDGGTVQSLGRVANSGWTTVYFPTNVTGRRIIIEAVLHTGDSTITPSIRTIELHFQLRPARRKMWHFQVIASGGAANQLRSNPTQMGATIVNNLIAARDSVSAVNFEDRFGVSWDAFVEEVTEAETTKLPNMPEPQEVVQVAVLEFKSGVGRYYVGDPLALVGFCNAA